MLLYSSFSILINSYIQLYDLLTRKMAKVGQKLVIKLHSY